MVKMKMMMTERSTSVLSSLFVYSLKRRQFLWIRDVLLWLFERRVLHVVRIAQQLLRSDLHRIRRFVLHCHARVSTTTIIHASHSTTTNLSATCRHHHHQRLNV